MASCGGGSSSQTIDPRDKTDEDGQSLLWRIEGKNLKEPSYIYGTMHAIPVEHFRMGERLEQLAGQSDLIVMEMDMDDINPFALTGKTMIGGGKTLEDIMEPGDYAHVKQLVLDSFGVSPLEWMMYHRMKPIFVVATLVQSAMGETKEYEMELMEIAKDSGVAIEGLETLDDQLALLDTIPLDDQVDILLEGLRSMDSMKLYLNRLVRYYAAEQLDSIEAMMNDPAYKEMMEFEDPLIYDRNKRWISQMADFMKKGQTLFAVGAAHLPGEEGVLNLLRQEGYTLTPIKTE